METVCYRERLITSHVSIWYDCQKCTLKIEAVYSLEMFAKTLSTQFVNLQFMQQSEIECCSKKVVNNLRQYIIPNIQDTLKMEISYCFEALVILCQTTRCPNLQHTLNMEALSSCGLPVQKASLTLTNPKFIYIIFKTRFLRHFV